ncbi:hypothetical protein H4R21_003538 [Coemansia helicoidea]|uniref:Uncharacterized protein n=1 Tax=Coemansia helicoidea TaxID=1286919 RepID=A0ACC1L264_9FUNG|nr:hypothetical protein H4R21_003538 [Coemansia helicoidea]
MLRATLAVYAALLVCTQAARAISGSQGEVQRFRPSPTSQRVFNAYGDPVDVASLQLASGAASQLDTGGAVWSVDLADKVQLAVRYLEGVHKIPAASIRITDAYTDSSTRVTHVYTQQVASGLVVANGLANVNLDASGRVISSSQSFAPTDQLAAGALDEAQAVARATPADSLRVALGRLAPTVPASIDRQTLAGLDIRPSAGTAAYTVSGLPADVSPGGNCTAWMELIRTSEGQVDPVWHIWLQQPGHWWSAHVSATSGRVEALNDWAYSLDACYRVLPWRVNSPGDGERLLLGGSGSTAASPQGWVTDNATAGNNVWAQSNPQGADTWVANHRPQAGPGPGLAFDYPFDPATDPDKYADYSVTQLFYTVNMMHDLSFVYGFDEAAGNFQDINYSGRGVGGDYVVAFAQDGGGMNNAQFMTPPDGQHGVMRMYLWSLTTPWRDGALEQDIVVHEYTHGISNRLTGGPASADCLSSGEASGMGEGWSDTVANIVRIAPNDTRGLHLRVGCYASGRGIRTYPYSTNMTANPLTYGFLNRAEYKEVHQIGEVWAAMLYDAMWNLMDAHGISGDLFAHDLQTGNALFLQLLLDGMKLQPCNPTFSDARDAIVQADHVRTGGANRCALWRAFAKRGLGTLAGATGKQHTESYVVPPDCAA